LTKKVVLLFDLDGVLVKPGGYRTASRDTLLHFIAEMGVEVNLPGEDDLSHYEAFTITNEWDMVPLSLAIILDSIYQHTGISPVQPNLMQCLDAVRNCGLKRFEVDYLAAIDKLPALLRPHTIPSQAILSGCVGNLAGDLFKFIPQMALHELLANTRDVRSSPTTRIFQQMILGCETFRRTYGLQVEIQSESYLQTLDRPLLSPESRDILCEGMQEERFYCAGLTLRPSLPPVENKNGNAIYSPETEMARYFIGLDRMPIIGYGEMNWLADQLGLEADSLIKPAPYQALTALASALHWDLSTAYRWVGDILKDPFHIDGSLFGSSDEIELHIFEDSIVGILACQRAAEILSKQFKVRIHEHGIGNHPVKVAALQSVGASIYADINQALAHVFR